jgi:D-glycero-D-manno-heptose 1,7-bisphosphate phosphatase
MRGAPAVFVDRDGTLILEVGYLSRLEQIEVLPGAAEAVRLLGQRGIKVVVITNQSGIARGLISEGDLDVIHQELKRRLARCGAFLDGIYYCPHHPTEGRDPYRVTCDCRKPNIGLVRQAVAELNLDLGRSYVVGDQDSDMELAARIGAKGILIQNNKAEGERRKAKMKLLVVKDLLESARWIIGDLAGKGVMEL